MRFNFIVECVITFNHKKRLDQLVVKWSLLIKNQAYQQNFRRKKKLYIIKEFEYDSRVRNFIEIVYESKFILNDIWQESDEMYELKKFIYKEKRNADDRLR